MNDGEIIPSITPAPSVVCAQYERAVACMGDQPGFYVSIQVTPVNTATRIPTATPQPTVTPSVICRPVGNYIDCEAFGVQIAHAAIPKQPQPPAHAFDIGVLYFGIVFAWAYCHFAHAFQLAWREAQ